ncbi:hypothetical protein BH23PLA1_BH23PLA1_01830 [soil metagenome]
MNAALHTLILLLVGLVPSDPEALVARLGSPRYADRESAARDLVELGREALPALSAARQSPDPEIRSRSGILLTKIERQILIEPTRIMLDFQDRPLEEVVRVVGERSGIPLVLVPAGHPHWRSRRLTLQASEPIPFWETLDRLTEAGQVQLFQPLSLRAGPTGRTEPIRLVGTHSGPVLPSSDAGPLRVYLHEVKLERQVSYLQHSAVPSVLFGEPGARPGPNTNRTQPPVEEQFYVVMQLIGEPRLMLSQQGPLRILEAVDDRGQSLLPPEATDQELTIRSAGYLGWNAGQSMLQLQTFLQRPEQPGERMALLRGTVPLTVASLKPDPLSIRLEGAKGRTFEAEDMRLTVEQVHDGADGQPLSLELVLQPIGEAGAAGHDAPLVAEVSGSRALQAAQNRLEVVDEQGRAYRVLPNHPRIEAGATRLTLMLMPGGEIGPPVEVRYYGLVEAETEITFEFREILIP